jgi:hypothetical protein
VYLWAFFDTVLYRRKAKKFVEMKENPSNYITRTSALQMDVCEVRCGDMKKDFSRTFLGVGSA